MHFAFDSYRSSKSAKISKIAKIAEMTSNLVNDLRSFFCDDSIRAPPLHLVALWPNRDDKPYHADGTANAGE